MTVVPLLPEEAMLQRTKHRCGYRFSIPQRCFSVILVLSRGCRTDAPAAVAFLVVFVKAFFLPFTTETTAGGKRFKENY